MDPSLYLDFSPVAFHSVIGYFRRRVNPNALPGFRPVSLEFTSMREGLQLWKGSHSDLSSEAALRIGSAML